MPKNTTTDKLVNVDKDSVDKDSANKGKDDKAKLVSADKLIGADKQAREALTEITPTTTVGPFVRHIIEEENVVSFLFECTLPGYPGWNWTVTLTTVNNNKPTVTEIELIPGDGALTAPDWIPWSQRLAEYETQRRQEETEQPDTQQEPGTTTETTINLEGIDDIDETDIEDDDELDVIDDEDLDVDSLSNAPDNDNNTSRENGSRDT